MAFFLFIPATFVGLPVYLLLDELCAGPANAYLDGEITKEAADTRNARLLNERAQITERLREIEDASTFMETRRRNFLELVDMASDKDRSVMPQEIRRVAQKVASNVLAHSNGVEFAWVNPYNAVVADYDSSNGGP